MTHATNEIMIVEALTVANSNHILEFQELSGKNAEMMEEVGKVRMDLNTRITSLENDRRSKEDLYNRISALEKELAGMIFAVCI